MHQAEHVRAGCLPVPPAIEPISEAGFSRFRELIERRSGISLGSSRKALLVGRLSRRLRALGISRFEQYLEIVLENDSELVEMLDCICTNETSFFREPKQFQLLESIILPRWRNSRYRHERPGRLRVWSAGCSTGEEPFSIAMVLASNLPASDGWSHQILATDISSRALRAAESATWDVTRAHSIPHPYLFRYMCKGKSENSGKMRATDELRALVHFERVNLKTVNYGSMGRFDAIFCRNVLIYFDAHLRAAVTEGLVSCLNPDGFLFLGHAEALLSHQQELKAVAPSVFQRVAGAR